MTITRSLLAAAVAMALCTAAFASEEPATPTAGTATPSPTSSTADNNTAQRTTEQPTASSFETDANTAAAATTDAATLRPMFLELDTDRDGFIARTELPAGHALVANFAEYDADRDEKLARGDFDRWLDAMHPDFAALDRNTDGRLTRAELPSAHVLYTDFTRYDTDSDGKLTKVEFDAFGTAGAGPVASASEPGDEETEEAE